MMTMSFIFYFFPDHRRAHCRSVDIKSNGDVPRSVRSEQIGRSPDTAPIVYIFSPQSYSFFDFP
jgi:hypothetical protein